MKTIGITGSIGMGKSFVAQIFVALGAKLFDADEEIHKMMEVGGEAVISVVEQFPDVKNDDGSINRALLGEKVFNNPEKLQKLESILHPLLRKRGDKLAKDAKRNGCGIIVKDIPLLFETGADKTCDYILVVYAPDEVQEKRVLARKNMTKARLDAIRNIQMPVDEKLKRCDFAINSDDNKDNIKMQVARIMKTVTDAE